MVVQKRSNLFFESNTLTNHSTIMVRSTKKGGAAQQTASATTAKPKGPKVTKTASAAKGKPKPSPPHTSSRNKPPVKADPVTSTSDAIAGVLTGTTTPFHPVEN